MESFFRPAVVRVLARLALFALSTAGCAREPEPDAYGNVEATEVVVGAEASGQLLSFTPTEGAPLAMRAEVGLIDTTQLSLQREQLAAQRLGAASRELEVTHQLDVLAVQREIAGRTYRRTQRLFDQRAATAQQLDQAERDFRVLGEQMEAARAQRRTAAQDVTAAAARSSLVAEQLRKSRITNPVAGTVLATYARAGEFVQGGQPLYRIANLDTVDVRAYVGETQLGGVRIGQRARVSIDAGGDVRRVLPGTITWIASQAEFTPTPIQTRDERADLVYAIKVRVPNAGGALKIGMPADVRVGAPGRAVAAAGPAR